MSESLIARKKVYLVQDRLKLVSKSGVIYKIQTCSWQLPLPLSENHEVEYTTGQKMYYLEKNGEVIAYISITDVKNNDVVVFTNIPALSVDKNYQDDGIGTALIQFARKNIKQSLIAAYPYSASDAAKHILDKISHSDPRICLDESILKCRLGIT